MTGIILFSGNAFNLADGKGRFVLPLEMRRQIKLSSANENKLCISIHEKHGCATGYGLSYRQALEDEIAERAHIALNRGNDFDDDAERAKIFPVMDDANFDDGGRFALSNDIKEFAGITDAIFFVGLSRYVQLWDPARYEASPFGHDLLKAKVRRFLAEREASGK